MTTSFVILPSAGFAFGLVILFWLLSEFIGSILLPALRRGGVRIQRRAVGLGLLSLVNWIVLFTSFSLFSHVAFARLPEWTYYAGISAMLTGIAVRQWAIAVLGRFFSPVIGVQEKQTVVKSGPYRLVRHPSYTGLLLIELGIGLVSESWGCLLAILAGFAIAFGYRIRVEEGVLLAELGTDYRDYMRRTKRLIPFLV